MNVNFGATLDPYAIDNSGRRIDKWNIDITSTIGYNYLFIFVYEICKFFLMFCQSFEKSSQFRIRYLFTISWVI